MTGAMAYARWCATVKRAREADPHVETNETVAALRGALVRLRQANLHGAAQDYPVLAQTWSLVSHLASGPSGKPLPPAWEFLEDDEQAAWEAIADLDYLTFDRDPRFLTDEELAREHDSIYDGADFGPIDGERLAAVENEQKIRAVTADVLGAALSRMVRDRRVQRIGVRPDTPVVAYADLPELDRRTWEDVAEAALRLLIEERKLPDTIMYRCAHGTYPAGTCPRCHGGA